MSERERKPSDVDSPDPNWYCWHPGGWELAAEGSVSTVSTSTRGQAAAFFAREVGDIRDVRVWKRYVRPLTRQDVWDDYGGRECWEERHDLDADEGPAEPPADWEADEYDPAWEFVHRSHADAIPVWVCGQKGDSAPHNPAKR